MPPKIVANERGISSLEDAFPVLSDQSFTYGIKNATIGVLFKNAEIVEVTTIILIKSCLGVNFKLNNHPKRPEPYINRIPAVTSINKKIIIIC
jgi:hypothetical protein